MEHGNSLDILKTVQTLCRAKKINAAKKICDEYAENIDHDPIKALRLYAVLARAEGKKKQQEEYLLEALRIDPQNRVTLLSLMNYNVSNGCFNEAIQFGIKLIDEDKKTNEGVFIETSYMAIAYCHYKLGNNDAAKECLEHCNAVEDGVPVATTPLVFLGELRHKLA